MEIGGSDFLRRADSMDEGYGGITSREQPNQLCGYPDGRGGLSSQQICLRSRKRETQRNEGKVKEILKFQ